MKAEILFAGATLTCPKAGTNAAIEVSVENAGWIETTHSRIIRDGVAEKTEIPLLFGRIRHPNGDVFVDAGLGNTTRTGEYPRFPLSSEGIRLPKGATISEYEGTEPHTVLTTHLHYDHIGGLLDLSKNTTVWTTEKEWESARTSNVAFPEKRMRDTVTWKPVKLEHGYTNQKLGMPAVDVKGDGSIWYLGTPGHTPGSASVLVHAADAAWLFIGDIAWVDEHLQSDTRPKWVSILVDGRPKRHKQALAWARHLHRKCPSLNIVPGHEPRWTRKP